MQFSGKLKNQNLKIDKKPNFGPNFCHLAQICPPQPQYFGKLLPTWKNKECPWKWFQLLPIQNVYLHFKGLFMEYRSVSKACFTNVGHAWDTWLNRRAYFRHFPRVVVWHLYAMPFLFFIFWHFYTPESLNLYSVQEGFHLQITLNLSQYVLFHSLSTHAPPF